MRMMEKINRSKEKQHQKQKQEMRKIHREYHQKKYNRTRNRSPFLIACKQKQPEKENKKKRIQNKHMKTNTDNPKTRKSHDNQ